MRKQNKRVAKRKSQLDNLHTPVRAPVAGFTALLLPCLWSLTCLLPLPACLGTPTALSSHAVPPLPVYLWTPITLMSCPLLAPVPRSPAVLLLLPMLGLTFPHLASTTLRTFKRALSDDFLRRSTSFAESLCPVPLFSLLPNKTNRKRIFNIAFINSCPLAGNHAQKKVDLSFAKCGCSTTVKLNWLWHLVFLDPKPVYIMEAIPLAAAIYCDPSFASCHCHIVKLAFKLRLKTRGIASIVVKERIESIWANRTISQLDQLF